MDIRRRSDCFTVWVLHGEADTDTPVVHARHTAKMIPGAKLLLFPDHGHISILTEIPELIAKLVSLGRNSRQVWNTGST
jgi:pimeloyl-ACP methyl ester carboxylesterase